jgi:hypothetical protein
MFEAWKNASNKVLVREEGLGCENPIHASRAVDMCSFQTDVTYRPSAEVDPRRHYETLRRVVSTPAMYLLSPQSKSQLGDRLNSHTFFVISFNHSRQIPG